ncbi:c6 zinc finger [Fusarium heterosporum]|uniref:C6 zinc finger n=1 Tax=Fusarium heterosporum TaxID=42747 RepID=A0A8H5SR71_FUSHE|nr:c6 zinc finger [Fusarium heterosporum]
MRDNDRRKRVLKHPLSTQAVLSSTILGGCPAPFPNRHISIPHTLYTSKEDIAISHFYNSTAENLPNGDPTRHLHQQLPSLYFQSQQGSVLRLAVEATSYACAANLIPQAIHLSSKCYIKALTALRTALQDPNLRFSDETLYGVLLLCGYETKTKQPSVRSAWGSHVDGAAALIKARGISDLHSSLFHDMFCFVRKSVVLGQMQTSKPVDKVFLKHIMSSYEDTEDRLVALAARVPQLQYTSCQLETSKDINNTEAEQLISEATELDLELSIWASSMSPKWSYASAKAVLRSWHFKRIRNEWNRCTDWWILTDMALEFCLQCLACTHLTEGMDAKAAAITYTSWGASY